jgi:hypothetical protein
VLKARQAFKVPIQDLQVLKVILVLKDQLDLEHPIFKQIIIL